MKKLSIAIIAGLFLFGSVGAFAAEILTPAQKKAAKKAKKEAQRAKIKAIQEKGGNPRDIIRSNAKAEFEANQAKKKAKIKRVKKLPDEPKEQS